MAILRGPVITRIPVREAHIPLRSQSEVWTNRLVDLFPQPVNPIRQLDWPNPKPIPDSRNFAYRSQDGVWPDRLVNLFPQPVNPIRQLDWPNPKPRADNYYAAFRSEDSVWTNRLTGFYPPLINATFSISELTKDNSSINISVYTDFNLSAIEGTSDTLHSSVFIADFFLVDSEIMYVPYELRTLTLSDESRIMVATDDGLEAVTLTEYRQSEIQQRRRV